MRVADLDVCDWAEAYALGALEGRDSPTFESHLGGCERCRAAVAADSAALGRLTASLGGTPPDAGLRQEILDLAQAPRLPLDVAAYDWEEIAPGVRVHVAREDPARHMRACLVWAAPGATHPRHRHHGGENILVLQGALRDERGTYRAGDICRSRADSVHSEEALPGEDCLCYVVYYGDLEPL